MITARAVEALVAEALGTSLELCSARISPSNQRLTSPSMFRMTQPSEVSAWIKSTPRMAWDSSRRSRKARVSHAPFHSLRAAAQVRIGYRVVRAFGEPQLTRIAAKQQLRRLLVMNDGARRPATLLDQRGVPLDARASDSSLAHGSADASGRFGSIDPAAAGYVSSRGVVFVETRFVSRAWQVVDGRLCGWSGPRR